MSLPVIGHLLSVPNDKHLTPARNRGWHERTVIPRRVTEVNDVFAAPLIECQFDLSFNEGGLINREAHRVLICGDWEETIRDLGQSAHVSTQIERILAQYFPQSPLNSFRSCRILALTCG